MLSLEVYAALRTFLSRVRRTEHVKTGCHRFVEYSCAFHYKMEQTDRVEKGMFPLKNSVSHSSESATNMATGEALFRGMSSYGKLASAATRASRALQPHMPQKSNPFLDYGRAEAHTLQKRITRGRAPPNPFQVSSDKLMQRHQSILKSPMTPKLKTSSGTCLRQEYSLSYLNNSLFTKNPFAPSSEVLAFRYSS